MSTYTITVNFTAPKLTDFLSAESTSTVCMLCDIGMRVGAPHKVLYAHRRHFKRQNVAILYGEASIRKGMK